MKEAKFHFEYKSSVDSKKLKKDAGAIIPDGLLSTSIPKRPSFNEKENQSGNSVDINCGKIE